MTTTSRRIPASDEAWEDGTLGRDESHVKRFDQDINVQLDEALELQPISIRLQKGLLESLKHIATINGIGYQPLIRQILSRFVQAEVKMVLREKALELQSAKTAPAARKAAPKSTDPAPEQQAPRKRRVA